MASKTTTHKGLLGSAVVGGRVTDLLDLNEVIHAASETWFRSASRSGGGKTVLVAEGSPFSRGLLHSELDLAGYQVQEAANLDEAIRAMERQPADVVLAAIDLPPTGSSALVTAMRTKPEWERIPVLGLADSAGQIQSAAVRRAGFEDCQVKFDGNALLESVARLVSAEMPEKNHPACVGEEK
jgi:two-component system chemotaxis sensor kinase CheA